MLANVKNAMYITKHVTPIRQSNLYLFKANDTYSPINVERSEIAE